MNKAKRQVSLRENNAYTNRNRKKIIEIDKKNTNKPMEEWVTDKGI